MGGNFTFEKWLACTLARLLCMLGIWLIVSFLSASVAVNAYASGCPNEVLRSQLDSVQLPDCRAYEQVSPISKNGWSVHIHHANGQRMTVGTLGSFGGGDQVTIENNFYIERTSQGWITSPFIEPPGLTTTSVDNPVAENDALTSGLFEERPLTPVNSAERNFYTWTLPDGGPIEVGPAFSRDVLEAAPVGEEGFITPQPSVSDGHVLYSIQGPGLNNPADLLWPGDSTVGNGRRLLGFWSLYEYSGVGNDEPKLVGVSNAGPLRGDREAQLISQCGTSLGFPLRGFFSNLGDRMEEAYNAISTAGEASRVFFTAASTGGKNHSTCNEAGEGRGPRVDELYARINGSETVAISEPSLAISGRECTGICREDENEEAGHGRSAGIFQGASDDGSKVFFLTEQPLVNGDNDHGTDLYEAEIGEEAGHQAVTRLVQISHDPNLGEAAEVQGVARIAEDGSHVYFVAHGVLTVAPNPVGNVAETGADNFYAYDTQTGQIAFIGALCSGAELSGGSADMQCPANLNSLSPEEHGRNDLSDWQPYDARPIDATPDGHFMVFTSDADLTSGDTSTVPQVFEYNAEARTLVRVSIGQNGFNDNGNVTAQPDGASIVYPKYAPNQNGAPQLTSIAEAEKGPVVVFQSADALVPGVLEGSTNVYEYENGIVSLISDGEDRSVDEEGRSSTSLLGMDASGQDIFFTTADRLIALDGDTQENIYDARVDGGFPPPSVRAVCEGEGCQGTLTSTPSFPLLGSSAQTAGENISENDNESDTQKTKTNTKAKKHTTPKIKSVSRCTRSRRHGRGVCATGKSRSAIGRRQGGGGSARHKRSLRTSR
jgi:hypothetical protein